VRSAIVEIDADACTSAAAAIADEIKSGALPTGQAPASERALAHATGCYPFDGPAALFSLEEGGFLRARAAPGLAGSRGTAQRAAEHPDGLHSDGGCARAGRVREGAEAP